MSRKRIMWAVASPEEVWTGARAKALGLAAAFGAELEISHCVFDTKLARSDRPDPWSTQLDILQVVAQRRAELERNADRLRGGGVRVCTSVRWDYPAYEGIVRQVQRHKPDLLIAQSAPKTRAAHWALVQTDFRLIETCPCPLLLIKTSGRYSAPRIVAAVDPTHAHAKPAALDGAIVDTAGAAASALCGVLTLFHARAAYHESVASSIQELAQRQGIGADRVHVEDGDIEERLPAFAHSERADIVVMGAVSRSLIKRVLIGHTGERLLDALHCDVLLVKPPGFRTPVMGRSLHHVEPGVTRHGRYIL